MKAREVIAITMGAMCSEAVRTNDPHVGNIEATMRKVVDLLDSLPNNIDVEMHVEVIFDVNQETA
jgi:hypothetical protein